MMKRSMSIRTLHPDRKNRTLNRSLNPSRTLNRNLNRNLIRSRKSLNPNRSLTLTPNRSQRKCLLLKMVSNTGNDL